MEDIKALLIGIIIVTCSFFFIQWLFVSGVALTLMIIIGTLMFSYFVGFQAIRIYYQHVFPRFKVLQFHSFKLKGLKK